MDYQAQQAKLFPPLAATWAFHFVAELLWKQYNRANESIEQGDLELLPDVRTLHYTTLHYTTLKIKHYTRCFARLNGLELIVDLSLQLHATACAMKALCSSESANVSVLLL